jgi:hypothetical protein
MFVSFVRSLFSIHSAIIGQISKIMVQAKFVAANPVNVNCDARPPVTPMLSVALPDAMSWA